MGPIVLQGILPHCNFILLKFGISVLLSEELNKHYNEYANDLLRLFVKHAISIYGQELCTYNTHSLNLSCISCKNVWIFKVNCFAFENYLGRLKRRVRKPNLPLEQIV